MGNTIHFIDADGDEYWTLNNDYHRDDGPAVILGNGTRFWAQHGQWHREDGPAVVRGDGSVRWCICGIEYTLDEYCKELKFTPEQILELKFKYG